jgi:hypothetical protein
VRAAWQLAQLDEKAVKSLQYECLMPVVTQGRLQSEQGTKVTALDDRYERGRRNSN